MNLIFDERKYAENLLANGPKPYIKTNDIYILARYYRDLKLKQHEIYSKVEDFCKQYNPNYNEVFYGNLIDKAVLKSKKYTLRTCEPVYVTKVELERIKLVYDYRMQKILFVMLVLCRYYRITNKNTSDRYYLRAKFSYILSLAHVYYSKEERVRVKNFLSKDYFIAETDTHKANRSNGIDRFILTFEDEISEKVLWISDLDNIISYYPFFCKICGKEIERKNNRHFMCDDCFREKKNKTMREIRKNRVRGNKK